ncbi:MAG: hypothetical protein FWE90_00425 [Defluviitaleaceae bacterium]|nr:hypothetical protein [Defluviitaleaceae bacterium]
MRLKEMLKAAKKKSNAFPEDAVNALEHAMEAQNDNEREINFVQRMEALLTEEQRLLLWEVGGSCTGGETGRQVKFMAEQLVGKPLAEKIKQLNQNEHIYKTELNPDGTVTAYCGCHCLQYRTAKVKKIKPPSHYGCAAGAAFQNLKIALGGKAKIKSIDYPQPDDGKNYMSFVFEVMEG